MSDSPGSAASRHEGEATDAGSHAAALADMSKPGGPYARYVLGVLFLVYIFNFLDRQILSILNEAIRADLGLSDAQMGFLYGTAFAVFYAVFGLPLGRLADVWDRRKLIAIGLGFWSAMTALSGLARNFGELGAARIGVGIGEASATPAAFSMLGDYFPGRYRATVLAIYSSGIYVGAGLSLGIGGAIVDNWDAAYPAGTAPFGLMGWQVAFFAVGLPGLLLALWVATLREPIRGMADGVFTPPEPHPFRVFFLELRAVVPPFTLYHLWATRAGPRGFAVNLTAAAILAIIAALLIAWLGSPAQWIAMAIGLYATFSWGQALARRDASTFTLILRTRAMRYAALAFGAIAFVGYGVGYWTAPYFIRAHGISTAEAGAVLGGTAAAAGFLGVTVGGIVGVRLRQNHVNGRLWVGMFVAVAILPLGYVVFTAESKLVAYVVNFPLTMVAAMWIGPGASTLQDLVLPRMRATCGAVYLLTVTFLGLALGPYTIGQISGTLDDHLGHAILIGLTVSALAVLFLLLAMRHLPGDESSLLQRARQAGETIAGDTTDQDAAHR
ncbi:MAG: spinster family MFS transporter [Pseudomonadales bacterium]